MTNVAVLLFNDFETLDVFGPVEILGRLTDLYSIQFYSLPGGIIHNKHGVAIQTQQLNAIKNGTGIFLIPGGYGTRVEVNNTELIDIIRQVCLASEYVLTVCTGTALLATTGLLAGRKATSNKRAFDWVVSTSEKVQWIKRARWVVDDKYYTSSGVSAGMDMTLGLLDDLHGNDFAKQVAFQIEYNWQQDKDQDNFCDQ
ncbi:MAG: DJ-1/PfpI family protein [Chitinophagaceae bacterium]